MRPVHRRRPRRPRLVPTEEALGGAILFRSSFAAPESDEQGLPKNDQGCNNNAATCSARGLAFACYLWGDGYVISAKTKKTQERVVHEDMGAKGGACWLCRDATRCDTDFKGGGVVVLLA